jgi:hypothetical protein
VKPPGTQAQTTNAFLNRGGRSLSAKRFMLAAYGSLLSLYPQDDQSSAPFVSASRRPLSRLRAAFKTAMWNGNLGLLPSGLDASVR